MIPEDRLARIDEIITRARATGNTAALAKAVALLADVIRRNAAEAAESGARAVAVTRASVPARDDDGEGDGLHKLRKGRDRCAATRRDGEPCQAPAIPGGLVCRRHGGAASQVSIAAEHFRYQMAAYSAIRDYEEARGTPREFDALCESLQARRDLDACEGSSG